MISYSINRFTKPKIAILISSNGLGHIKRNITLAKYLSKKYLVTLFTNKKKISKFKILNKIKIENINFNSQKEKKYYNKKIHNFIKIKGKFDLYLSDNYPESILNKKNTIILSNFFWHHIHKIKNKYYEEINKKLKKTTIISNYLFCSSEIKKKFDIIKAGFYGNFKKKNFTNKSNGILLSFGTADNTVDIHIKKFIKSTKSRYDYPIFIDKKYYSKNLKKFNIQKANYSNKMFSKIAVAIIKPGLGIITDCLAFGIPIITFMSKKYNQEFKYNNKVLNKINLTRNFNKLIFAIKFAHNLLENPNKRKKIFFLSKRLRWNGEKTVIRIIKKNLKND